MATFRIELRQRKDGYRLYVDGDTRAAFQGPDACGVLLRFFLAHKDDLGVTLRYEDDEIPREVARMLPGAVMPDPEAKPGH